VGEMEFLDIDNLSALLNHLAKLAGIPVSLYSSKGDIILQTVNEPEILKTIKYSPAGISEYNEFVRKSINKAILSHDVSIFKGPEGGYHFFAPVSVNKNTLIISGGGIYLSSKDFERFIEKKKVYYSVLETKDNGFKPMIIENLSSFIQTARHIKSIFAIMLTGNYKYNINEKKYRVIKIMMEIISDINDEYQKSNIFSILSDMILFFFNAESLVILIRNNGMLEPILATGKLRDYLKTTSLKINGFIEKAVEEQIYVYNDTAMDIMRAGLNEDIVTVSVFPIITGNETAGVLNIINTNLSAEDIQLITETCRAAGLMLRVAQLQEAYQKYLRDVNTLWSAAERIIPLMEPDELYNAILETSVRLAEAEKGSLLLAENNSSLLTIKAARGIHKKLFDAVKIKPGEGIAGKVFTEGIPVLVDDIEKIYHIKSDRKYKYKTGSFLSIPLKIGDRTIGVLNIADKITGGIFSEEDMSLIRSFASYATIALERSNYYNLAEHLRELSITDSLTGLFNRRYFEERFIEELHRSERHNLSFSLAMIDIDDFKLFNDTEGHISGDEMLKAISFIAKETLRVSDVIARFGGEEFAVIMPQTGKEEAFLVTERIRKAVREMIPRNWKKYPKETITVSIGIASFPEDGANRKEIIRSADRALYRSKMEGKDRTTVWTI
jgi:diguanylate cyclase (GGDEF)-like protein